MTSSRKIIYISRAKLRELLQDPLFVAYAPGGKISGGLYNREPEILYMVKRGVE